MCEYIAAANEENRIFQIRFYELNFKIFRFSLKHKCYTIRLEKILNFQLYKLFAKMCILNVFMCFFYEFSLPLHTYWIYFLDVFQQIFYFSIATLTGHKSYRYFSAEITFGRTFTCSTIRKAKIKDYKRKNRTKKLFLHLCRARMWIYIIDMQYSFCTVQKKIFECVCVRFSFTSHLQKWKIIPFYGVHWDFTLTCRSGDFR